MGILVYRDKNGQREFIGRIDYSTEKPSSFVYDNEYVTRAFSTGEFGVSESLPLDIAPYSAEEFGPFFRGLLPEGETYGNLAELYQVARSDYLTLLEQIGCESIGALTFVSERVDPVEYEPQYEPVSPEIVKAMLENPARMATITASSTRLSLAGAQSKIAWLLPQGLSAHDTTPTDWLIPKGTAPSTHIIKISRKGEEEIALNELACSKLAEACGIETARINMLSGVPGAITVERYDRVWSTLDGASAVVRLHQEDFCQALGLAPFYKYQPQGTPANYPAMAAELIEAASDNPIADKLDFAKRLVFCYSLGNSDAHFKNFSLLYNRAWTGRRLAPLYDVACIPLTGYSTDMPFEIGEHRALADIDERDLATLAIDLDTGISAFDGIVESVVKSLESPSLKGLDQYASRMVDRIIDNSSARLQVLKSFLGSSR